MSDEQFFSYLEANMDRIITEEGELILDAGVCEQLALTNCRIKYAVVEQDEHEHNL
ncbi:hypothetical protein, partial [Paenibacillus sonchi]